MGIHTNNIFGRRQLEEARRKGKVKETNDRAVYTAELENTNYNATRDSNRMDPSTGLMTTGVAAGAAGKKALASTATKTAAKETGKKAASSGASSAASGAAIAGAIAGSEIQRQNPGSTTAGTAGGALSGASTGYAIGGPWGAAAGAVIGGVVGANKAKKHRQRQGAMIESDRLDRMSKIEGERGKREFAATDSLKRSLSNALLQRQQVNLA